MGERSVRNAEVTGSNPVSSTTSEEAPTRAGRGQSSLSGRNGTARTPDGEGLRWDSIGSGRPIVCCNGVGVSTFFWKYVAEEFAHTHQVIRWDYRGHGRSTLPRNPETHDLSVEQSARDLFQILEAAEVDQPAILMGHSMGCQVILEAAHQQPDRVAALVPMFGTFRRPLDTFMNNPRSRRMFDLIYRVGMRGGRRGSRLLLPLYANPLAPSFGRFVGLVDRHKAPQVDIERYIEHLGEMDTRVFLRMVSLLADHDLTAALPHIHAPALVVAGGKDHFTPLHCSQEMAARLPNAQIQILESGSHAALVEHGSQINEWIRTFLDQHGLG